MPKGARERKKATARAALEATAFRLFRERGYEDTTVDDIAEASGLSPRTFFRYFGSKDEVVVGRQAEHLVALRELVRHHVGQHHAVCGLFGAVIAFAEHLEGQRDQVLARAELIATNASLQSRSLQLQRAWEEQLTQELAVLAGRAHADVDLHVLVGVAMTACCVGLRSWQRAGADEALGAVVRRSIEALESRLSLASPPTDHLDPDRPRP